MAQRVGMNSFREARALSCFLAGMPDGFGIDGLIAAMILVAGKEPDSGFSPQAVPVLAEFVKELGAEHHIAVLATFTASDVKNHALTVDIPDFQVRQLGTP